MLHDFARRPRGISGIPKIRGSFASALPSAESGYGLRPAAAVQEKPSRLDPGPAKRSLRERFGCNWPSEWRS